MAPNPIHVCHTLTPSELNILSSGVIEVLFFQGHSEIQTYTFINMNCKFSDDYPDLEHS